MMMATSGRRLLPMQSPRTGVETFAWLIRAIRAYHPSPDIRDTATFARRLATCGTDLRPTTINRLENAELSFTIERCLSYEEALQLAPYDLVDPFLYLTRIGGATPGTALAKLGEASHVELELLWRLGRGEKIAPYEWIRLAYLYRNRRDLFTGSERMREAFFGRLMEDAGRCYEKDLRLIREALIVVGDDVSGDVATYCRDDPLHYFNTTEALGFMDGEQSWSTLLSLGDTLDDGVLAGTIIEPVIRRFRALNESNDVAPSTVGAITEYSAAALCRTDVLYTAREEALVWASQPNVQLTVRARHAIADLREDVAQLRLKPATFEPDSFLGTLLGEFADLLEADELIPAGLPPRVPGLGQVLGRGIFSQARVSRLAIGLLLRSWHLTDPLTDALGRALHRVSPTDYGVQRAIVRMMVKLGSARRHPYFSTFGRTPKREDGVRLVAAWALGEGEDPADQTILAKLYGDATTRDTKRVIVTAAERRVFVDLLATLSHDPDSVVSGEAERAMRRLGALKTHRTEGPPAAGA
ncbi:hypothetical protein [Micromonospora sp. NPDC005220]|uniref:hypothetical protein n=1 Tax=Micromonospora sp. NPDC005220 TaxID=3155589 RepID=UPI0033B7BC49